MKLTPEAAQALTNLRGNNDFSTVLEWLSENKVQDVTTLTKADGLPLHRAQGRVQLVDELQASYDDAPRVLAKLKS